MARTKTMCPCCGGVLFTLGALAESVGAVADGPVISHDKDGAFMCCRHCRKRVVFEPVAPGQAETTYRVGDTQLCAPCR